jgi:hypothetical protein
LLGLSLPSLLLAMTGVQPKTVMAQTLAGRPKMNHIGAIRPFGGPAIKN